MGKKPKGSSKKKSSKKKAAEVGHDMQQQQPAHLPANKADFALDIISGACLDRRRCTWTVIACTSRACYASGEAV